MRELPAALPTPSFVPPEGWWPLLLEDPTVRLIVIAAVVLLVFVLLMAWWSRWRQARQAARLHTQLRASYAVLQEQREEILRAATKILATSSTGRITGFTVLRQVEAVFSEGQPSSAGAVEHAKALAAGKGANAIINLQTQQTPAGKWVATGDAVVVRPLGGRG